MKRFSSFGALLLALGLTSCTEYAYTARTVLDLFQQVRRNTVDILIVVDNSGSMAEEQDKLASNFDAFIENFSGIDVDWQIAVVTTDAYDDEHKGRFRGGDDEIELLNADGRSIDRVAWDRTWGVPTGVAWQLDPGVVSSSGNDVASAWCAATSLYGTADLGTPGEPNAPCSGGTSEEDPTAPSGVTRAPASTGDLLITEFMADPSDVADEVGEWVELWSRVSDDLDLTGCVLRDDGRNAFTFPEGTVLPAGERLVVARSDEAGVVADVVTGPDFTLNNDILILTPETEGASELFAEMVAVGIVGSGIEMGLEALRLGLSEPTLSEHNAGFLREGASLSIIALSDEEDSSPYTTDQYLVFLTDLKGEAAYRDHSLMQISAVVGKDEPEFQGQPACSSENGVAEYGSRWVKVAQHTEGVLESICEEDFSPIAQRLGLTISGLEAEFGLSEPCAEDTLKVSLYETPDDAGFVRDLERDVDFTYVAATNSILFVDQQVPPSEWYVLASYEINPGGATTPTDTGGVE